MNHHFATLSDCGERLVLSSTLRLPSTLSLRTKCRPEGSEAEEVEPCQPRDLTPLGNGVFPGEPEGLVEKVV